VYELHIYIGWGGGAPAWGALTIKHYKTLQDLQYLLELLHSSWKYLKLKELNKFIDV
jgi:hypothetical protein